MILPKKIKPEAFENFVSLYKKSNMHNAVSSKLTITKIRLLPEEDTRALVLHYISSPLILSASPARLVIVQATKLCCSGGQGIISRKHTYPDKTKPAYS